MSFRSLVSITAIIAILFMTIPAVSAYVYEVGQGDTVYLGEYVDISRVMSWSGQFAYWYNGEPTDRPDLIVDVNDVGHMYNYYIDPQKYVVGTWWKWDGEKERAGNMLAFKIAKGVRNNTYISSLNPEPTIQPLPENPLVLPAKAIPKDTNLLLVRGDEGTLKYGLGWNTSNGRTQNGYIWLFGNYGSFESNFGAPILTGSLMGVQMNYTSNDSVHSFTFNSSVSSKLTEGMYTGYFQFVGNDGRRDIFYRPAHKISFGVNNSILDTPYDDDMIPDIPLEGYVPMRVQQELERLMTNTNYVDDVFIPITVEVISPSISIGDYWEEADDIIVRGSTPFEEGTIITVMIDPENYNLIQDVRANTFTTTAVQANSKTTECITTLTDLDNNGYNVTIINGTKYGGGISTSVKCVSIPRVYTIKIPIKWGDMSIGTHTIRASIDSHGVTTTMSKDFKITGEWINPEPTKELKKVIVIKEGSSHLIDMINNSNINSTGIKDQYVVNLSEPRITATPTLITNSSALQPEDIIVYMNETGINLTEHPNVNVSGSRSRPIMMSTPPPTTQTPIPEPTDDVTIPINPIIALLAIVVAGLVLTKRKE